jgi:hypothetical protein
MNFLPSPLPPSRWEGAGGGVISPPWEMFLFFRFGIAKFLHYYLTKIHFRAINHPKN